MSTNVEDKMCSSPRWQRNLHHRLLRKMALDSRRPGGARKTPSHRHVAASKNNVQIFKCELRGESGTTNTMKTCEILPKATQTDERGDCQILLVEIIPNFQV